MTIKTGDKLPEACFKKLVPGQEKPIDIKSDELFKGKKVILVGVPGAFTPTCHGEHVPGYVKNMKEFKQHGIDAVYVVAVNDAWVMKAWAEAQQVPPDSKDIMLLADGGCNFTKAIGLNEEFKDRGLGTRCKRYAMLVDDGIVKHLSVGKLEEGTGAEQMLSLLKSQTFQGRGYGGAMPSDSVVH